MSIINFITAVEVNNNDSRFHSDFIIRMKGRMKYGMQEKSFFCSNVGRMNKIFIRDRMSYKSIR